MLTHQQNLHTNLEPTRPVFTEHIDGAHHGIGIVEAQREKIVFRYLNVDDGSVLDEVRLSGAGPWPWGEPEI